MYFGGVGLPEAKFRFIWSYHALPAEVAFIRATVGSSATRKKILPGANWMRNDEYQFGKLSGSRSHAFYAVGR